MPFNYPTSDDYIKYVKPGTETIQSYAYPATTGGSSNTYFGDYHYYNFLGPYVLSSGGDWDRGAAAGLWSFRGNCGASYSDSGIGGATLP